MNNGKKTLQDFFGISRTKSILICGLGNSLNLLKDPRHYITIGCNDIGRKFTPNYLVVLNPLNSFKGDRKDYIQNSNAEYVFSQLPIKLKNGNLIQFKLGKYNGTAFNDSKSLDYTQNSPYVALCLAVHMGAKKIGVIGLDFTENHFYKKTGTHPLVKQLNKINEQYKRLNQAARNQGVDIINLSSESKISAFRKGTFSELGR